MDDDAFPFPLPLPLPVGSGKDDDDDNVTFLVVVVSPAVVLNRDLAGDSGMGDRGVVVSPLGKTWSALWLDDDVVPLL